MFVLCLSKFDTSIVLASIFCFCVCTVADGSYLLTQIPLYLLSLKLPAISYPLGNSEPSIGLSSVPTNITSVSVVVPEALYAYLGIHIHHVV